MVSGDISPVRRLRPAVPTVVEPKSAGTADSKPGTEQTDDTERPERPASPTDATSPTSAESDAHADRTGEGSDQTEEATDPSADRTDADSTGASPADTAADAPRVRRRRRIPFAHARRRLPPLRRLSATAARALRDWARRPSGRLTLPGLLLLALVSASSSAGALLVPAAAPTPHPASDTGADPDLGPTAAPSLPPVPEPDLTTPADGGPTPDVLARPSDPLAGWAQQIGSRVGIPPEALQAYGYAEWVLSQTNPGCQLRWTTLAAIGKVESDHGRSGGASIGPDGTVAPPIRGLPLDGQGGRKLIRDTDNGLLDNDSTYDRAVGPMQFIPTTWQQYGADADGDGVKNPHDIDDAALAAGQYLCEHGRNLANPQDWWNAILSYNNVQSYADKVFATANEYGIASRG